jgi:hypothetical protein
MDRLGLSLSIAEGYHLFTDRYFSSVHLAQELDSRKFHITGTVVAGRVGNQKMLRQGPWRKWWVVTLVCTEVGVLSVDWRDKSVVLMISIWHINGKSGNHSAREAADRNSKASMCTWLYGGVDWSDHYCTTYAFIQKSLRWWRKLFNWCLKICIVNLSYI